MSERTLLEFDTAMGRVWPAAKFLSVCAWPDSQPQRTRLVEALLHGASRAAGYRHTGPDLRVIDRRLERGTERLNHAFLAAEVAQLKCLPASIQFGQMEVLLPSRHAVGPGGKVSTKRLQQLIASE